MAGLMSASQVTVDELLARAEIERVLMTYCRVVDRGDVELMRSVYHAEGTDAHGSFFGTGWDFAPYIVAKHDAVDLVDGVRLIAQHHITNTLFEFAGATCNVESYFLAVQPYQNPGEAPAVGFVGGRYLDRFEHLDGRWAISERRIAIDWSRANMEGADWPGAAAFMPGGRRDDDPSDGFFGASPAIA